ncbi:ribonuclease [Jiella sp. M17.18]|uniref:ribonuclease T2 family protein n=1 Tax=Jiella sp. M17.18 TaxID=3234247 RepID=UPI0034DDFC3F
MAWTSRMILAAAAAAAIAVSPAAAEEPLSGYVIARSACSATPSIRNAATDPALPLQIDRAYRLIAENRANGTHYLIEVPGAQPERRWIEKRCGIRVAAVDEQPPGGGTSQGGSPVAGNAENASATRSGTGAGEGTSAHSGPSGGTSSGGGMASGGAAHRDLLLAISWEPAFCETHSGKPECRAETASSFEATHFSLHGLWPQPRGVEYCGVSAANKAADRAGRWDQLPEPQLDPEVKAKLDRVMPGTQSLLERHEWLRHGTCYGTSANEYFSDAIAALAAINASPVGALFAGALERPLTSDKIRGAFDQAFGQGAGARVRIACDKDGSRRLIGELTIGLVGEITPTPDMQKLIMAAKPTSPGCTDGIVDAVGLQ